MKGRGGVACRSSVENRIYHIKFGTLGHIPPQHSTAQQAQPRVIQLYRSFDPSSHRAIEHHQQHHQHIKQNEIQKQKAIKEPLERFVDFNDVCIGDDFPFRFWPCKTDTARIRHLLDLYVCVCVGRVCKLVF